MERKFRKARVLKFVVLFFVIATAVGFVTMSLWNWLVPVLFHGPVITYWQAMGLLLLSKILFGFKGRGGHGHHGWGKEGMRGEYMRRKLEQRMSTMTEEQKEKLRARCNFWEKEGMHGNPWDKRGMKNEAESRDTNETKAE